MYDVVLRHHLAVVLGDEAGLNRLLDAAIISRKQQIIHNNPLLRRESLLFKVWHFVLKSCAFR